MLQKVLAFFTPKYHELRFTKVVLLVLSLSFFLRFPFFFRDYIDRDESTFILLAQSWVDGYLPYTQLWDLKPPLTFLFFAVLIKVFGKSILLIRIFGTLLVSLIGILTYKIGHSISTKKIGFWAAISCVVLQSMFGSVQGVMSEHISVFPFCMALYLLFSKKQGIWHLTSGLLVGVSIMSKLNMVYPAFFLGVFLLYEVFKNKQLKKELPKLLLWVLGMVVLILGTAIPYYFENSIHVWWQSIFMAPLAYSSTKLNSVLNVLPFCGIMFVLFFCFYKFKLLDFRNRNVQLLFVTILGIIVSFIQAGKINGHYLIQLYPFALILLGMGLSNLKFSRGIRIAPLLFFVSIIMPFEAYSEYVHIAKHKIEKGTFYNGEGFTVPRFLEKNNIDHQNIFFTEYHIGYWVLAEKPLTKPTTHPSNLTREELFPYMENPREKSIDELVHILVNLKPSVIVARKNKKIFNKKFPELNSFINSFLKENYTELAIVDQAIIYQRLK